MLINQLHFTEYHIKFSEAEKDALLELLTGKIPASSTARALREELLHTLRPSEPEKEVTYE